jgi:hypothetical protein
MEGAMKKAAQYLITVTGILSLIGPIYAQPSRDLCRPNANISCSLDNSVSDYLRHERYSSDTPQKQKFSLLNIFKSKAYAAPQNNDEDRKKIREEWKEFLGLDVFYPYFKAKEVEEFVAKKSSVKLFNMQGKAEFNKDSKGVKYIFKSKF